MKLFVVLIMMALWAAAAFAQPGGSSDKFSSWMAVQMIPSPVLLSTPSASPFGFEWEATPLLYSFGMTKLVSPWYSFLVEPPARFTGSIELIVSGQIFTTKVGRSYFGSSVQLLGHIPLIEMGGHLGLNIGVARYSYANADPWFKVLGVSSIFGMLHFNIKHSSSPQMWMGSLEFRMF